MMNSNVTTGFIETPIAKGLFCILYGCIFILGMSGNVLVVMVVLMKKNMQTITNIFITNLAISDILMCMISVPFTPIEYFMKTWDLPETLCKILSMTMSVTVHVSTLTSTAIAINRFLVIKHPLLPRMQAGVCAFIISTIWITASLISFPQAVFRGVETTVQKYGNVTKCKELWPGNSSKEIFSSISFLLQFIIPGVIITYCYCNVSQVLKVRCKNRLRASQKTKAKEEIEINKKRRTNNMLIAVIVIFATCWVPLNVFWLIVDYKKPKDETINHYKLTFFFCHMIAMTSSIYNPFIYGWMNENFKKEFRHFFNCLFQMKCSKSLVLFHNSKTNIKENNVVPILGIQNNLANIKDNPYNTPINFIHNKLRAPTIVLNITSSSDRNNSPSVSRVVLN